MAKGTVVVVGAGITGILAALSLRRSGWSVTVLEAAHIGAGSSSRTAAGIRQQFSTPGTVAAMLYSVGFYRHFGEEIGERVIVENGYLFLYGPTDDLGAVRERVRMQQAVGLKEVELLVGDELYRRFPWVSRSLVVAGTFCPSDGFLHPHLVYNEGARLAREAGVVIHQNAPVQGATLGPDGLASIRTPQGSFSAERYLDCTNAWTRRTSALLGATELEVDPLKRYLWFVKREGVMTPDQLQAMPLTITPIGTYCRPENPNTLLMGKKHDTPPEVQFSYEDQDRIDVDYSHKSGVEAVPYALWVELAEYLPPVGDFGGIVATTSGYYGVTPDHNPFLGYDPALPNLIRLVGFSGHGAMFGPFTAATAVALVEAGRDVPTVGVDGREVPMDAFAIGRTFESHEAMVL